MMKPSSGYSLQADGAISPHRVSGCDPGETEGPTTARAKVAAFQRVSRFRRPAHCRVDAAVVHHSHTSPFALRFRPPLLRGVRDRRSSSTAPRADASLAVDVAIIATGGAGLVAKWPPVNKCSFSCWPPHKRQSPSLLGRARRGAPRARASAVEAGLPAGTVNTKKARIAGCLEQRNRPQRN